MNEWQEGWPVQERKLDQIVAVGLCRMSVAIERVISRCETPQIEVEQTTWSDQAFEDRLISQRALYAAKKAS